MNDLQKEIVDGSSDILEFGIDLLTKNEVLKEIPLVGLIVKTALIGNSVGSPFLVHIPAAVGVSPTACKEWEILFYHLFHVGDKTLLAGRQQQPGIRKPPLKTPDQKLPAGAFWYTFALTDVTVNLLLGTKYQPVLFFMFIFKIKFLVFDNFLLHIFLHLEAIVRNQFFTNEGKLWSYLLCGSLLLSVHCVIQFSYPASKLPGSQ